MAVGVLVVVAVVAVVDFHLLSLFFSFAYLGIWIIPDDIASL